MCSSDLTDFQQRVWARLRAIPRGQTRAYGQIADAVEAEIGHRCSARAVGGAVGRNPISVIVPCHRVVGADGSLTGYAGGTDRKMWMLRLEGARHVGIVHKETVNSLVAQFFPLFKHKFLPLST